MRTTSIRHLVTALCLFVALTLAVAPAALPAAVVPTSETTIAASWATAAGPRGGYYARIIRSLRRLFGMDTEDVLSPPLPTQVP